ncbi:MAG: hypothetical protein ACRESZ_05960 [Methylococcales bacterium]
MFFNGPDIDRVGNLKGNYIQQTAPACRDDVPNTNGSANLINILLLLISLLQMGKEPKLASHRTNDQAKPRPRAGSREKQLLSSGVGLSDGLGLEYTKNLKTPISELDWRASLRASI